MDMSAMCVYIDSQSAWDVYQFGVCSGGPPPNWYGMGTTDGVQHATQAACQAAGCACP
jgi:hypothetical protein